MRQGSEHGQELQRAWRAWVVALLTCIAMTGLFANTASAEDPAVEEAAEAPADATTDAAAEADEVTPEELAEAQKAIDDAQKALDEAREKMGDKRIPYDQITKPDAGPGLISVDGRAKKLQVSLNEDGSLYLRFAAWLQVWTRAIQNNPGTTVLGKEDAWYGDVGLRRARFLMFGKIFPRTFLLMHIGINNQSFRNFRKPQLFFHDAWLEFEASKKGYISIGGGLLYWNGISRLTKASTITFMRLDAPIVNCPTIERTDQFARQMGLYAKGKVGLFDYRIAVVRPFSTSVGTAPVPTTNVGNYNDTANTWGYSGYFMLQFLDEESNTFPYTVGTYIGAKKVFNWGWGGHAQPIGITYLADPADPASVRKRALFIASTDLFLDIPFKAEKGGAATWYGAYYYMDFGPNNVRNIGIMNPGDPTTGTSFNGQGNAYPMIGTGHTGYSELGILIPGTVGKSIQFQPYVNSQMSKFEVLNETMFHFGAGINMFIHRHNAKVTLEYRNRPIFDQPVIEGGTGNVSNRKGNSIVLQMHLFI